MILDSLLIDPIAFERETGWAIKPEGACKGDHCVPLPSETMVGAQLDVRALAARLGMPIVADESGELWSLGPEAGGRALTSAVAPDLTLPDWRGEQFQLASLRGQKVLLVAWASW